MYRSILAISEGGPDAVWSFRLAAVLASMFDAVVDAVHFSEVHRGDLDIATQSLPFQATTTEAIGRSGACGGAITTGRAQS